MNTQVDETPSLTAANSQQPELATRRELTVSSIYAGAHTSDGRVPYIRMSGQWLEQIGFTRGAKIAVTAGNGELLITIAPAAPKRLPKRRPKKTRNEKPLPHLALAAVLRRRTFQRRMAEFGRAIRY